MKLNNAQDAIKQAIEGGYREPNEHFLLNLPEYAQLQLFCDPLFWQALGKVRGWKKTTIFHKVVKNGEEIGRAYELEIDAWKAKAILWFETRLSNGDETKFWENLP